MCYHLFEIYFLLNYKVLTKFFAFFLCSLFEHLFLQQCYNKVLTFCAQYREEVFRCKCPSLCTELCTCVLFCYHLFEHYFIYIVITKFLSLVLHICNKVLTVCTPYKKPGLDIKFLPLFK